MFLVLSDDCQLQGACNSGDYCLVDGYCCPAGVDAGQCALSLGVTLPATYVASTATVAPTADPAVTTSVPAYTTATTTSSALVSSYTPSVPSVSVAVYTGAASSNSVVGGNAGMLGSILALVLNLF